MILNDKRILAYSLLIAVVVLSVFPVIRMIYFNSSFIAQEHYRTQIIAADIISSGIPETEPYIERPYLLNPHHLAVAGLGLLAGAKLASVMLPFILGIISVIIFYLILKEFRLNYMRKFLAMVFLIISPAFIYLYSSSSPYSFAITASLIAFLLFLKKTKKSFALSFVLFMFSAFFGLLHSIITSLILISCSVKDRQNLKKGFLISALMIIISLAYTLPFYLKNNLLFQIIPLNPLYLIGLISDLGGISGFGIFTILLMIFGMYVVWKYKKQPLGYIFLLLAVAGSMIYSADINFYLLFPISLLASYGFYSLLKMRWTLSLIKQLAVIVVIAGIIFSSVSYLNQVSKSNPSKEMHKSFEWLAENSDADALVLSHPSRGLWIESVAGRKVFLDSVARLTPMYKEKLNLSSQIFYSRTLLNTTQLLLENSISYIWVDSEMKDNLVWTRKEEGLLFLFRNSETFKKVYNKKGIEIWEVIAEEE